MANYTSNLKSWGSTGAEYPSSYSYAEGEQPVDAWDNFVNYNLITDVKAHLIPLTNSRIESDKGATGGEPNDPDRAHYYYDINRERPTFWDESAGSWKDFATQNDTLSVNSGNGLRGGGSFPPTGGSLTLNIDGSWVAGHGLKDGGSGTLDFSAGEVAGHGLSDDGADNLELTNDSVFANAGDGLKGGGSTALGEAFTFNVEPSDFAGAGLNDDGSDNLELSNDSVTVAGQTVSLGGSVGVYLGDLANVGASGEGHGNGFNADMVDGAHVYVQSSAPSNPDAGDVWVDTS